MTRAAHTPPGPSPERTAELRALVLAGGEMALADECTRLLDAAVHRAVREKDLRILAYAGLRRSLPDRGMPRT